MHVCMFVSLLLSMCMCKKRQRRFEGAILQRYTRGLTLHPIAISLISFFVSECSLRADSTSISEHNLYSAQASRLMTLCLLKACGTVAWDAAAP